MSYSRIRKRSIQLECMDYNPGPCSLGRELHRRAHLHEHKARVSFMNFNTGSKHQTPGGLSFLHPPIIKYARAHGPWCVPSGSNLSDFKNEGRRGAWPAISVFPQRPLAVSFATHHKQNKVNKVTAYKAL